MMYDVGCMKMYDKLTCEAIDYLHEVHLQGTPLPETCEFYQTFNACAQDHDLRGTGRRSYIPINDHHFKTLAKPFLDDYRAA